MQVVSFFNRYHRRFIVWFCMVLVLSAGCSGKSYQLAGIESATAINQAELYQHVKYLADDALKGRKTNSQQAQQAAFYIAKQLADAGIPKLQQANGHIVPFSYQSSFKQYSGNNVIGFIQGTNASTKHIVLTAHYDHIGMRGNKVFNGADDNASGVAALLELAKTLNQVPPKHNIVVLFTDGEEVNLNGARAFAQDFPAIFNNTLLNINLDMLAGTDATRSLHYISSKMGTLLNTSQRNVFRQLHTTGWVKVKNGFKDRGYGQLKGNRKWRLASDHGIFYQRGIPILYYGVGTHKHYHQASDTFENINKQFLWLASNTIYQQLRYLDQTIDVK